MPETLYGPWTIKLARIVNIIDARMILSGTNADGQYSLSNAMPEVSVTGSEWTINLETYWPDQNAQYIWTPKDLRRSTRFDHLTGLTLDIEYGTPPSATQLGPLHEYAHLICTSNDDTISPPPVPNPYDFTIPERPLPKRS